MKRFLSKRFLTAGLVVAAIVAFAGTCTIQHISLTTIGTNDVFAGEVHNDSGVSILQHNVIVAFIGTSNNLLETKTVQPCLRTLPTGGVNYFSAQSSFSAAQTSAGLARVNFDSTFKVGTPATGSGTITNLKVSRSGTALTVTGTFQNLASTTLTSPNACAVVYNSSGNVVVVGIDETSMIDLVQNGSDNFTISLTVPDSTTTVDHVNVYVDGFQNNVPTLPVSITGNAVVLGTPTPTVSPTPVGTPGAAAQLKFLTTLSTATHDASFGSVQVAIEDAVGHVVTSSTANVTLSIESGTGSASAVLTCTNAGFPTIAAVSGVATFTGCMIDRGGLSYHLKADSAGLTSDISNGFNVTAGPVAALNFTTGPASGTSGATQSISVTQTDLDGVNVWNDTSAIALAILNNVGSGTLTCGSGLSVLPSNGIATFTGCSISKAGAGYTLRASKVSPAVTGDSPAFTMVGKLVFTTQPSATAASGVNFAQQPVVKIENGDGTVITTDNTTNVTLTSSGGTLACTATTVQVAAGVATFAACNITTAGTYHLIANDDTVPAAPAVNSTNIVISP